MQKLKLMVCTMTTNKNYHSTPYVWHKGSYMAGEIIDDRWVYYDYYGEDENPEKNRYEENPQKFSYRLIDEKYNDYTSLIFTPKYIKLLSNETNVSDEKVLDYICNVVFREENEKTRERNNKKRREKYETKKIYG